MKKTAEQEEKVALMDSIIFRLEWLFSLVCYTFLFEK